MLCLCLMLSDPVVTLAVLTLVGNSSLEEWNLGPSYCAWGWGSVGEEGSPLDLKVDPKLGSTWVTQP
jgi:hypothetical protein